MHNYLVAKILLKEEYTPPLILRNSRDLFSHILVMQCHPSVTQVECLCYSVTHKPFSWRTSSTLALQIHRHRYRWYIMMTKNTDPTDAVHAHAFALYQHSHMCKIYSLLFEVSCICSRSCSLVSAMYSMYIGTARSFGNIRPNSASIVLGNIDKECAHSRDVSNTKE